MAQSFRAKSDTDTPPAGSFAALREAYNEYVESLQRKRDEVVLYMTLNSTTHNKDELSESLAALDQAEKEGLGKRSLLPISDPYANGDTTYDSVFGEARSKDITFWTNDPELKEGEVRLGKDGEPLMLGTDDLDLSKTEDLETLTAVRDNWDAVLEAAGMDAKHRAATIQSLLGDSTDPRRLGSGNGATNELVQYAIAMYRAEKGEYDVKSLVLSGHHWSSGRGDIFQPDWEAPPEVAARSGRGIWGEFADGSYDHRNASRTDLGGDFFGLEDVSALKSAYPKAYSQVESVQLAACNTHNLGMVDEVDNPITTNQWLQGTFENIERASYWQGFAPKAKSGAWSNGEFLLDDMRADEGKGGWSSLLDKYNKKKSNEIMRSELVEGSLQQIDLTQDPNSYVPGKGKRLRGRDRDYRKVNAGDREHLYSAGDERIGMTPEKQGLYDAFKAVLGRYNPFAESDPGAAP